MLELRPICENCAVALPPAAADAMICTFECTFCRTCVDHVLAPSRHMRDRFLPIVPAERIDVSEYGVARERFVAARHSSSGEPDYGIKWFLTDSNGVDYMIANDTGVLTGAQSRAFSIDTALSAPQPGSRARA